MTLIILGPVLLGSLHTVFYLLAYSYYCLRFNSHTPNPPNSTLRKFTLGTVKKKVYVARFLKRMKHFKLEYYYWQVPARQHQLHY